MLRIQRLRNAAFLQTNFDDTYVGTRFGFRTVCQAPNVGTTVTVNDVTYTVEKVGAVYTIEPDMNAPEGVVFDSTCTLLHYDETAEKYVSNIQGLEVNIDSTGEGVVAKDDKYSTYVQTIEGSVNQFPMANII